MIIDRVDLLLSVQRGLLENVFSKLRAVCAGSTENTIFTYFYHDSEITEEERELCEHAIDQIMSDFFYASENKPVIEFQMPVIRIDYPKRLPLRGDWVYYRHEDSSLYID